MASGAASLTLKLAAVFAVLVIPSLGRCPSLGPAPPPPEQAPPPPLEAIPPSPPPVQAPPPPFEAIPPPPPPVQAPPPPFETIPPPSPPMQAQPPPPEAIPPPPLEGIPPAPRCDICRKECYPACIASHPDSKACDEKCSNYKSRCDQCRALEIEKCKASCTGTCNCDADPPKLCSGACDFQECGLCASRRDKDCKNQCNDAYCKGNHCW